MNSKSSEFQLGDKVRVMDKGLLMLQQFAPKGAKPNNEGVIYDIWDDGIIEVEFPLEGYDHIQCAPYHPSIIHKINPRSSKS
jgi:hypothetical protein